MELLSSLLISSTNVMFSLVALSVKNLPAMQETQVWFLGWKDSLEKEMAIPSSILAWRIPQTEEPGRLWSMRSQRVRHDWVITLSLSRATVAAESTPWKKFRVEIRNEALCALGKTGRSGLQIVRSFRRRFYESQFLHLLIPRETLTSWTNACS